MSAPLLDTVRQAITPLEGEPGALLPMLHAVQEALGYVPAEAIPEIARRLGQTRAEVAGVLSFYHEFRTSPGGAHTVQLCRAEACQAVGARDLERHARARLGIDYHQTTADRQVSLEPVYCLGNCACGPSMRIGERVYGRVSPARFDQLLDHLSTCSVEVQG